MPTDPTSAPLTVPEDLKQEIDNLIHDLAQPLTMLQWRLELGNGTDDPTALHQTIADSLTDVRRLCTGVALIRERLLGDSPREDL